MPRHTTEERERAQGKLREILVPGDTVYTILRHVSKSGMVRDISPIFMGWNTGSGADTRHNTTYDLTYWTALALDLRVHPDHSGVRLHGCGMDMGFALVYDLSRVLWPTGFGCVGDGCLSNDHSNGDRDYTPHVAGEPVMVNGERIFSFTGSDGPISHPGTGGIHWHHDGGYALRQRWL